MPWHIQWSIAGHIRLGADEFQSQHAFGHQWSDWLGGGDILFRHLPLPVEGAKRAHEFFLVCGTGAVHGAYHRLHSQRFCKAHGEP